MTKAEVMEKLLEGYQALYKEDQGYKDVKEMAEYMKEKGLGGFPYEYTYKDTFASLEKVAKELEGEGYLEREVVNDNIAFRYRKEIESEPENTKMELRIIEIRLLTALKNVFKDPKDWPTNNKNLNSLAALSDSIKNIQEIRKNLEGG